MIRKLSLKELPEYLKKGAILIHVRSIEEYRQGHLNGAINIPQERILESTKQYPKETTLILYCSTGSRSRLAANLLVSMGYSNIYDMGKVSL